MHIGVGVPNQVKDVDARLLPWSAERVEAYGFSALGTVGRIA